MLLLSLNFFLLNRVSNRAHRLGGHSRGWSGDWSNSWERWNCERSCLLAWRHHKGDVVWLSWLSWLLVWGSFAHSLKDITYFLLGGDRNLLRCCSIQSVLFQEIRWLESVQFRSKNCRWSDQRVRSDSWHWHNWWWSWDFRMSWCYWKLWVDHIDWRRIFRLFSHFWFIFFSFVDKWASRLFNFLFLNLLFILLGIFFIVLDNNLYCGMASRSHSCELWLNSFHEILDLWF